jgi:hypothetical protein
LHLVDTLEQDTRIELGAPVLAMEIISSASASSFRRVRSRMRAVGSISAMGRERTGGGSAVMGGSLGLGRRVAQGPGVLRKRAERRAAG